jgi:hypothetical protein
MKTFTKIEKLLELIKKEEALVDMMVSSGAATRTDAGANYYLMSIDRLQNLYIKLGHYPFQWVQAVHVIIRLRPKE